MGYDFTDKTKRILKLLSQKQHMIRPPVLKKLLQSFLSQIEKKAPKTLLGTVASNLMDHISNFVFNVINLNEKMLQICLFEPTF